MQIGPSDSVSNTNDQSGPGAIQLNFITRLGIQPQFLEKKNHSLVYAYSKYKEYCRAKQVWETLKGSGTWSGSGNVSDLMEVFASSSYFYSHYIGMFKSVYKFPELVAWLEGEEHKLSDLETWGFEARAYDFTALRRYLAEHNQKVDDKKKKKGKGKEQELLQESDEPVEVQKDKGKEKEKEETRTRERRGAIREATSSEYS